MRGVYAILISVRGRVRIRVGSLGRLSFKPGVYVYVGSGSGEASTSIEGRLIRHFSKTKRRHWHIDYLLSNSQVEPIVAVFSETKGSYECALAKVLSESVWAKSPFKGFGSSDCSCLSHLIYFKDLSVNLVERVVKNSFRALCLTPRRSSVIR